MATKIGLGVVLALASIAPAQGAAPKGAPGKSGAFEQACTDLLHGKLPPGGAKAVDSLRKACEGLMDARTQAQRDAEEQAQARQALAAPQQPAKATPGGTGAGAAPAGEAKTTAAADQGTGVGAAFEQAGSELMGPKRGAAMGMKRGGQRVGFTLTTNPVGWFTGLGVNAELFGRLLPNLSWVGGAQYSRTEATNGTVDTVGIEGGADYFLIGKNNEGLRVGPRMELAFGRESFQTSTNFAWLGLSGEIGYNFIATNGITGMVSAGFGGRIAGDKQENFSSLTGGELGPYAKVGIGYSW